MGQTIEKSVAEKILVPAQNLTPSQAADPAMVEKALELLEGAKNPWIIIGKGAALGRAEEELAAFVDKTNIPFQPMSMAKGLIPDDDPHSTASCRGLAMRTADVILLVGARLNWMLGYGKGKKYNPNVKFIQIDIDESEFGNARPIDCPLVGDAKTVMGQLVDGLATHKVQASQEWLDLLVDGLATHKVQASQEWLDLLAADAKKNNERFGGAETADTVPMTHQNALGAIKRVLDKNQIGRASWRERV